jgi:hypothetical protein
MSATLRHLAAALHCDASSLIRTVVDVVVCLSSVGIHEIVNAVPLNAYTSESNSGKRNCPIQLRNASGADRIRIDNITG